MNENIEKRPIRHKTAYRFLTEAGRFLKDVKNFSSINMNLRLVTPNKAFAKIRIKHPNKIILSVR